MALRLVQVNFKARDDAALGRFWAQALGWEISSEGPGLPTSNPWMSGGIPSASTSSRSRTLKR